MNCLKALAWGFDSKTSGNSDDGVKELMKGKFSIIKKAFCTALIRKKQNPNNGLVWSFLIFYKIKFDYYCEPMRPNLIWNFY